MNSAVTERRLATDRAVHDRVHPQFDQGKKMKNVGEAWALADFENGAESVVFGEGNSATDGRFGWQVVVAGDDVVVASKWTSSDRRAEIYPDVSAFSAFPSATLRAIPDLEPSNQISGNGGLGDGWASGGIGTGNIDGIGLDNDIIIGAPNARCDGSPGLGLAYLYLNHDNSEPQIFVPPFAVDPDSNFNAFGWSTEIVRL